MKDKIYYTVERDLYGKVINVYTIENNDIELWFDLEVDITEVSIESIKDYLYDNGYGNTDVKIIEL